MNKYIINADDFGLNRTCTEAIIEAFNKKLISSSTMCANGLYFDAACALARECEVIEYIGIHLNITEGAPLTENIKKDQVFCDENGFFHNHINRLKPLNKSQRAHLSEELSAQIEKMRLNGFPVTHGDSHHHIHTCIFIAPVCLDVFKRYCIGKIRLDRNIGRIAAYKRFMKKLYNIYLKLNGFKTADFFGSIEDMKSLLGFTDGKVYEFMVHPDYDSAGRLIERTCCDGSSNYPLLETGVKALNAEKLYSYTDI